MKKTSPLPALPFFLAKKRKSHLAIEIVPESGFRKWHKSQEKSVRDKADILGFTGQAEQILILRDQKEQPVKVAASVSDKLSPYDFAAVCAGLSKKFPEKFIGETSFEFAGLKKEQMEPAVLGWALGCYSFSAYKQKQPVKPGLLVKGADTAKTMAEAVFLLKNMVNEPANRMGPEEMESAVRGIAALHNAKVKVVKGEDLLKQNFPLVHAVGQASSRAPRLIEMSWGSARHPKLTLVGKGVAFDTGGLNIKGAMHMALMKKDMGGAAHVLALAHLVMSRKLPVSLQLLIPAVENSIAGNAFRPGDIIQSRKGLFVENTNTDAEGRLILADSLTYACERKPELIVDYATLTGSARAALGPDIPALFSNNEKTAEALRKISFEEHDPLWPMPLWEDYKKHIESSTGDLINSSGTPGDLPFSALFLKQFLDEKAPPEWVHIDCYAWEHAGRPGRPRGGADTGLRAVFAYLEKRFRA